MKEGVQRVREAAGERIVWRMKEGMSGQEEAETRLRRVMRSRRFSMTQ